MVNTVLWCLYIVIGFLLAMTGASIFSFLNVVAYRLPRGKNFIKGSDYCPDCNHELKAGDKIPVLSYLCLKGKCRYCKKSISPRYFFMEILGAVLLLICVFNYENYAQLLTNYAFLCIITIVALIDIDTMEIPDRFHVIIAVLGIISCFAASDISIPARLFGVISVSVPMLLLTLVIPGAFGGGDIKLMAASGLILGWQNSLLAAFIAVVTGGIYGIWLLKTGKKGKKDHFAFGPFLCIGMAAAILYGDEIINFYIKLCGF